MRLDMAIASANLTCLFENEGPMTKDGNSDGFAYLPGRYFACAVRTRFAGGYGHDYVAKLLSVAGDDAPPRKPALYYPHLAGDDQGSVCGWRWRKHHWPSALVRSRSVLFWFKMASASSLSTTASRSCKTHLLTRRCSVSVAEPQCRVRGG